MLRWSVNRDGKALNSPQSLTLRVSALDSTDLGFQSLCCRIICIHVEKVWRSRTCFQTEKNESGNYHQPKSESWKEWDDRDHQRPPYTSANSLTATKQKWGRAQSPTEKVSAFESEYWGFKSLCSRKIQFLGQRMVEDPNRGSQMKKIPPHQFLLLQQTKLD